MTEIIVLARIGGDVTVQPEIGPPIRKFVGDRRYSKKNRTYFAVKAARQIVCDIDYEVFGDDWRWLHASTPPNEYRNRVLRIAKAIANQ